MSGVVSGRGEHRPFSGARSRREVLIDLEFGDETAAHAFLPKLEQIMSSPQAQAQLVRRSVPRLYAVVSDRVPSVTG